jgi:hypothetical protein
MKTIRIKFLFFVYISFILIICSFIFSYGALVSIGRVNHNYNFLYDAQEQLRDNFEGNVINTKIMFEKVERLIELLRGLDDKLSYAIEKNLISIEVRSTYKKELDKYNNYFDTLIGILTKGVK